MKNRIITLLMLPTLLLTSCSGSKNNNSGSSNTVNEITTNATIASSKADNIDSKANDNKKPDKKTIIYNTKDYVHITIDGYKEGEATLDIRSDPDEFYDIVNHDFFDSNGSETQLAKYRAEISESIVITADKDKELKNGDVIKITLEADNSRLEYLGVAFAGDTYEYTVHGLMDENGNTDITIEEAEEMYPDAQVLDPFEGLNVGIYTDYHYLGYNYKGQRIPVGSGEVQLILGDNKSTHRRLIAAESDRTSLHSPGDKVELICDVGMFSYIEDGYIIYPIKKEFVLDYFEE